VARSTAEEPGYASREVRRPKARPNEPITSGTTASAKPNQNRGATLGRRAGRVLADPDSAARHREIDRGIPMKAFAHAPSCG